MPADIWEISPLSNEAEYRRLAALSLDLAARSQNLPDKWHLLAIAEAWLELAGRAKRPTQQRELPDHPLVKMKFGGARPDPR